MRHLLITALLISGCATTKPNYDPNARESVGRIIAKAQVGGKVQVRADSYTMSPAVAGALYGAIGAAVAEALENKTTVPIFEYTIELADGRNIISTSYYSENKVGECVKIFESPLPSYPRFISWNECNQ